MSIYRANFLNQSFSFSLRDISNLYLNYFETIEEYKIKFSKNIYDYSYEELIKNPNNVIPEIINWLDWDWDEKYLEPHKNKRNVFTASSAQIRKKFYSSSIGSGKNTKSRNLQLKLLKQIEFLEVRYKSQESKFSNGQLNFCLLEVVN